MGTYTARLGLYKPAATENVNVETQLNANYDILDNCVLYNSSQTITGNWTFSGSVTLSNLASGSTDTVIVHNNGLLRTRTIDSRVWGNSLVGYSSSGSNYIAKFSGANTITSSVIYESSGKIGIGTTSPSYTLDVLGDGKISGNLGIGISPTAKFQVYEDAKTITIAGSGLAPGGNIYCNSTLNIGNTADNGLFFFTNSTQRMVISAAGNVGIGVSSPSYLLDVNGDARFIGKIGLNTTPSPSYLFYDSYYESSAGTALNALQCNRFRTIVTSSGTYYKIGMSISAEMNIESNISNAGYLRGMYIQAWRNSIAGISDSGSLASINGIYIQYGHRNENASETPSTTNAYGIYIEPRVQTGTIQNLYGLYIASKIGTGATNCWGIYQADSYAINEFYGRIYARYTGTEICPAFLQYQYALGTYYCVGTYGNDGVYNPRFSIAHVSSSSPLRQYVIFKSGYSSSIGFADWIFDTGKVGIGTTTPSSKLTIAGTHSGTLVDLLRLETTGTAQNTETGICFYELSALVGRISLRDKGTVTMMSFSTYNNSNVLNIIGNKVGINITEPTSVLDVYATTGYDQLRLRTTYTPSGSSDTNGEVGNVTWDDNYIYIKTSTGWKRAALSSF